MNNKELLLKIVLAFWGVVIFTIILKTLITYLPKNWNFSFDKKTTIETPINGLDHIYFPLKEQYGFTIDGYESCTKDFKASVHKEGYGLSLTGSCWNGECSITVVFDDKVPQDVDLYVKKNNECVVQNFTVPTSLTVMGYYVDLQLSEAQKNALGIVPGDKVRLEHANGYSLDNKHKYYTYNTKIMEDNILVNDINVGKIYFSKNIVSSVPSNLQPKIDIPHPEELFTFDCTPKRVCKMTANSYIVNVNGIDLIPDDEFIIKCLNHSTQSKYCKTMISIGNVSTPQFSSDSQMKRYIKETKNPEYNDDFEAWEVERFKKAQEELMLSL